MPRLTEQGNLRKAWESGTLSAMIEVLCKDEENFEMLMATYFSTNSTTVTEAFSRAFRHHSESDFTIIRLAIMATIAPRYLQRREYLPRNTKWICLVLPSLNDNAH